MISVLLCTNYRIMTNTTTFTFPKKVLLVKYPVASFIVLTFLITHLLNPMVVGVARLLYAGAAFSFPMGYSLLAQWGPAVAALFMITSLYGLKGLYSTLLHIKIKKSHLKWLVLVCLLPIFMIGLSYVLAGLSLSQLLSIIAEHWVDYLSVFALLFITAGLGEELGWRGFLLPQLVKTKSVPRATFIIMIVHGLWHFNRFFSDPLGEPLHAWLMVFAGTTIIHIWLFFSSGGSLLIPILFHACFDAQYTFFSKYISADSLSSTSFHQGWTYVTLYFILGILIILATKGKLGFNSATFSSEAFFGKSIKDNTSHNMGSE